MNEIKVLDSLTASKIAAGEVVERPLNVVKELVENSIDAGASKIILELSEGGTQLIRVTDDGKGIMPDELELAVQRFATSKASTVEDVYNISTYGFRGEALAAISSVSDFSVKSVRDGYEPSEIKSSYGILSDVLPAAISKGTQVTVANIFENLPVRKKFLKGQRANEQEILKFIKQMSFHNCGVQFIVNFDNKEVYRTFQGNTMLDIAKNIFSEDRLVYHENEFDGVRVRICLSNPSVQRKRRDGILFGVNGRVIRDTSLVQAVLQAYHRCMPSGMFPYALVDITIQPRTVDVNIHPSKSEVRFEVPSAIFHHVKKASTLAVDKSSVHVYGLESERCYGDDGSYIEEHIKDFNSLKETYSPSAAHTGSARNFNTSEVTQQPGISGNKDLKEDTCANLQSGRRLENNANYLAYDITLDLETESTLPENSEINSTSSSDDSSSIVQKNSDGQQTDECVFNNIFNTRFPATSAHAEKSVKQAATDADKSLNYYKPGELAEAASGVKVLGQMSKTYIVCAGGAGELIVIDQHVAHERVLYEKYAAERTKSVPSITLFEPLVIELDDDEYDFIQTLSTDLERFGYHYELFGGSSVKITMVPVEILKKDVKKEFTGILHDAMELKRSKQQDYAIVTMSCRNAVKAGDELTMYEMQHLVDMLYTTRNPHTCPHGRPIIFIMGAQELDKKFQR